MFINLSYIFFILVGIYFGIIAYMETRKREIFLVMGIFVISLVLEIVRLNKVSYKLNVNDVLWKSRDIIWTLVMVYFFEFLRDNFPYQKSLVGPKKKINKIFKK